MPKTPKTRTDLVSKISVEMLKHDVCSGMGDPDVQWHGMESGTNWKVDFPSGTATNPEACKLAIAPAVKDIRDRYNMHDPK